MIDVYIQLFKKRPILTAFSIFLYIVISIIFVLIAKQEKATLSDSKFREMVASEIFKSIHSNTNVDTISNQVKIIFNSFNRQSKGKLDEYGLVSLLEDIYAQNATNSKEKSKLKILMELIAKQKEKDP